MAGEKMKIDEKKDIQRLELGGEKYILIREPRYNQLLEKLESLDTEMEVQRAQAQATGAVANALIDRNLSPKQVQDLMEAPNFGKRIELLRDFRNVNQKELAKKAGVSQTTISNIERNKVQRLTFDVAYQLLLALDVPASASSSLIKKGKAEVKWGDAVARVWQAGKVEKLR